MDGDNAYAQHFEMFGHGILVKLLVSAIVFNFSIKQLNVI